MPVSENDSTYSPRLRAERLVWGKQESNLQGYYPPRVYEVPLPHRLFPQSAGSAPPA